MTACTTCGTEPLESARFCHGCGAPVGVPDTPAEYKQVTVLFADVVRSMDIASAVGAERLREILADLVDRAKAIVQRYGGTLDKFTGDGIMAVFGAPVAMEDHAFHACMAALEIQDASQDLAAEVDRRDGVELRLRVGLNSGQVIAGEIGSASVGYTAIGEQVGMAQRMESVAAPGGVLVSAAGDKVSLAIGMTGLVTELFYAGRSREGSRLASEQMVLLESIGDPTLTMGLAVVAFVNWCDAGEFGEVLRWSQTVIDLAGGDPAKGAGFGFGSPLATALAYRGLARWWLGRLGWRQDLHDAVAMARQSDPATLSLVVCSTHGSIPYGVLRADDAAVRASEEAVHTAGSSHDVALSLAECTLGITLLYRDAAADRRRGLELMVQARDLSVHRQIGLQVLPVHELWAARERARRGDRDAAIAVMRQAVNELHRAGRPYFGVWGTGVLVETLLERGASGDLAEAQEAIDRLANLQADQGSAMLEITLLRLRALLARAHGDETAYRDYRDRYRTMATSLGFEGHVQWAEAMP